MSKVVQLVNSLTHDGHEFKEGKKFVKTPHPSKSTNHKYLKWLIGILLVLAAITITAYFLVRHHETKHPYHPHVFKHGTTIEHINAPSTTKIGEVSLTDVSAWEPTQYTFGDTVKAVYKPVHNYPLPGERTFQFIMNDVIAYSHTTLENEVTFTIPSQQPVTNAYYYPDANCFMQVLLPSGEKGHFQVQSSKVTVGYGLRWAPGTFGSSTEKTHTAFKDTEIQFQLDYRINRAFTNTKSWTISHSADKKTFTAVKVDRVITDTARKIVSLFFQPDTLGTFYYRVTFEQNSVVNDLISDTTITIKDIPSVAKLNVLNTSFTKPGIYYPSEEVFPTLFNPQVTDPTNLSFEYNPDSNTGVWTRIDVPVREKVFAFGIKGYFVTYALQSDIYRPRYRIRARDGVGGSIVAESDDFIVRGSVTIDNVPSVIKVYTNGSHTETPYPIVVRGSPDFEVYNSSWTSPLRFRVEVDIGANKYILSQDTTLQGYTHLNINFNAIRSVQAAGTKIQNAVLSVHVLNNLDYQPSASHTISELEWVEGYKTTITGLYRQHGFGNASIMKVQALGSSDTQYGNRIILGTEAPYGYKTSTLNLRFSENSQGTKQIAFDNGSGIEYYWTGNSGEPLLVKSGSEYTGDTVDWTPLAQSGITNGYKFRYGASQYLMFRSIQPGIHNPYLWEGTFTTNIDNAAILFARQRLPTE